MEYNSGKNHIQPKFCPKCLCKNFYRFVFRRKALMLNHVSPWQPRVEALASKYNSEMGFPDDYNSEVISSWSSRFKRK